MERAEVFFLQHVIHSVTISVSLLLRNNNESYTWPFLDRLEEVVVLVVHAVLFVVSQQAH